MKIKGSLLAILFLLPFALSAQQGSYDPQRFGTLLQRYNLDDADQQRLKEILAMSWSQALTDRQNFRGSSLALYQAARTRKEREQSLIAPLLDEDQRQDFFRFEQSPRETELFAWEEGLLLDELQKVTVRSIIDHFSPQNPSGEQNGKSRLSGSGPGQPGRGRGGMRGQGRPMTGDPVNEWVSLQKKKAKEIRSCLRKDQLEQFDLLFEHVTREGKEKLQDADRERPGKTGRQR